MKKLLLLVFLMFTALSYAGYETNIKAKISKLERQKDAITEEYGFGYKVNEINEEFNKTLDDELTKVYNLIMKKKSKSEQTAFRNKQRQWLKKREQQVNASIKDEDGNLVLGGSFAASTMLGTYADITKKRLYEFARIYDKMKK